MDWIHNGWDTIPRIVVTVAGIYLAVIVLTRLNGLRTYAKMSSFDFAITVAVGSVVAGTVLTGSPSLTEGVVALSALLGFQRLASWGRLRLGLSALIDNEPLLLMVRDEVSSEALAAARITEADVYAKLREANVLDFDDIRAVVLEATGDISVLHGDPSEKRLNPTLLEGVRGADRFVHDLPV